MITLPSPGEMYEALLRSDATYEGVFVVAVKTTKIFCRPTCPARKPLRENVEFFTSATEALFAGYRPCKRCKPMHESPGQPDWLSRLLAFVEERADKTVTDQELKDSGYVPATVRRYFKSRYGMTFQAYNRALRVGGAFAHIRNSSGISDAAGDAEYESDSGFRDAFRQLFGESPRSVGECLKTTMIDSPLGALIAVASDDALCLLEFTDRRMLETQIDRLKKRFNKPITPGACRPLEQTASEIADYFRSEREVFDVKIEPRGSEFQLKVWEALVKIPYGETRSYGDLANELGNPGSQRAVGRANGDNGIAIIVPCHRVVGADGTLTGYGGGLWRKRRLLDLESGEPTLFRRGH